MFTSPVARLWPRVAVAARLCPVLQSKPRIHRFVALAGTRFQQTASALSAGAGPQEVTKAPRPEYELSFTCKPCQTRSKHRISKQAYHFGSVCVACPTCKNRHVISDHLNFFGDQNITIEELMQKQGQKVKKGTLSEDGTFEIWDDGSSTKRSAE
ncbi:hypothetical protein K3495_g4418 [Podosphaera aphanis]|nr:hypothetical protein K3495_g4418 [Podosphaera aphanis]